MREPPGLATAVRLPLADTGPFSQGLRRTRNLGARGRRVNVWEGSPVDAAGDELGTVWRVAVDAGWTTLGTAAARTDDGSA